jgi:uncharacterized protein
MQKRLAILTSILVFCAIVACAGIVSAQVTTPLGNVIQATGSGTVTGTPDRVQISFSVETENPDVKTAQTDNAARMTQVINALVTAGISRDSMKTTGYSIYPVYADNPGGLLNQKVQTYRVTNTLQVTLNDVARSGDVIDTAVTNGINQVSSIQFMLSDGQAQSLRSSALRNAVANARADAYAVAGAMAVNITGTKNVDISQGYTPIVYDNSLSNGIASRAAAPTPIQPGDITVTATVTISYTYT